MSGADYPVTGNVSPWHDYVGREHAARDRYLNVVQRAHQEYLTGPWPDRGAYEVVERQAWITYYAAGRDAWCSYRAALETPPPPPPPPAERGGPYTQFPGGWPPYPTDLPQPTFNPIPGGDQ